MVNIAEKNGLIRDIGQVVLDKVCKLYQKENLQSLGLEYIEVNLSLYQFFDDQMVEKIMDTLMKYGIDSSQINFEITETAASTAYHDFVMNMRRLRRAGFAFSLDDYGTSYSNLSKMVEIDFKNIKIDKSLLWNVMAKSKTKEEKEKACLLLQDTIRMIRKLGMNVIQEGVETKEQLNLVTEAGCELIQGHYYNKALPSHEFIDYVKKMNH